MDAASFLAMSILCAWAAGCFGMAAVGWVHRGVDRTAFGCFLTAIAMSILSLFFIVTACKAV